MPMIGYGHQSIDHSDCQAVQAVLHSQALTCGPAVAAFEGAIAAQTGAAHAVAVANGTSALRLLYQVAGVGPGVRVGVPAITFVATAVQALQLGAEVVLLDVDPSTMLLTPSLLAACDQPLDVVVAVHVAGRLCDMAGLAEIAQQRDITLLEDAAHAFGSTWTDGGRCGDGRYSRGAIFSFHPVKNITTGEGGAVVVSDATWAERLRSLRHHGIDRASRQGDLAARDGDAPWYHEFVEPAGNERLSDVHAALGLSQCRRLTWFKSRRAAIVERYRESLETVPWLSFLPMPTDQEPFWHLATTQVDWQRAGCNRAELFRRAAEAGFALQVHYIPLQHQPVFRQVARASQLTGADQAYQASISLPCHPELRGWDQGRMIEFLATLSSGASAVPRAGPLVGLRLLLTGDTGLLGGSLLPVLRADGAQIFGCARSSRQCPVDCSDANQVADMLERIRPDVIIHSAALADVDACEADSVAAWRANVETTRHLCASGTRVLLISTDQVYDGPGPHVETQVAPRNVYAFSKLIAEELVRAAGGIALRCNFFGPGHPEVRPTFSDRLLQVFRDGVAYPLFTDVQFSPIRIETLYRAIVQVLGQWRSGVYNCGSSGGMSKRDFAHALAQRYDLDASCCLDRQRQDLSLRAYRPDDMRMDSSLFQQTFDFKLPSLMEEIRDLP